MLRAAVRHGSTDMVRLLIQHGARGGERGDLLLVAAEGGNADIFAQLLAAGALVDSRALDGRSALQIACGHARRDMVRLLVLYGARGDLVDVQGPAP